MAKIFLVPINLNGNELQNAVIQNLGSDPGTPVEGQIWWNTSTHQLKAYDGTSVQVVADLSTSLSAFAAPTGDLSIGSHKLTNVTDPGSAQDAATKAYVDNAVNGLDWKNPVRAASTANVTIASGLVNGATVDGVTLATGDRVLLKNQTTASENGIYVTAASGAASRSTDASTGAQLVQLAVAVEEGSTQADTFWVCTTNAPITIGTTSLTFAQWGAGATYTNGTGLSLSGNTFSIENSGVLLPAHGGTGVASPTAHKLLVGNGSSAMTQLAVGASNTVLHGNTGADPSFSAVDLTADVTGDLPVANGGTGSGTASGARANLGATTKYSVSVGDGSSTSITVTHNLGTLDVVVGVYRNSDGVEVVCDVTHATTNTLTLAFASAPSSNQYRCVVIG